jgi:ABC-type Fe3+-hydroxamate transport system substrate-binding protein
MKAILIGIAITASTITACSENSTQSKEANNSDTAAANTPLTKENLHAASSKEVVTHYLHLKNALTNDNAKEAATAGKAVAEAIQKIGAASLTADQKKVYDDVKDDMKEHGEHISANASKIEHQRQHFEMLTNGLYDLVKVVGSEQALYKDHCPMYNDNKGANWLSEVKEIKNPYLGKKMLTCGAMKEEIK